MSYVDIYTFNLKRYSKYILNKQLWDKRSFKRPLKIPHSVYHINGHKVSIYYKDLSYKKKIVKILHYLLKNKSNFTEYDLRVYLSQVVNYHKVIILVNDLILFNNDYYITKLSRKTGISINRKASTYNPINISFDTYMFMRYIMFYPADFDYNYYIKYSIQDNIWKDFYLTDNITIYDIIPYRYKDIKSLMYIIGSKLLGIYQLRVRFDYQMKNDFEIYYPNGIYYRYNNPTIVYLDNTIYETLLIERNKWE